MKLHEHKLKLRSGSLGSIEAGVTRSGKNYFKFNYKHPAGIAVISAYDHERNPYSSIDFVYNGELINWSFDRFYTAKGLARIANKLIKAL